MAVSIRRKVISTRSPMARAAWSTSVSWQRNRPPPSKSMTAATIGGLGVKASRSTVKVATAAPGVGHGDVVHPVDGASTDTQTRAGGRCTAPQLSHRLPTKAYL